MTATRPPASPFTTPSGWIPLALSAAALLWLLAFVLFVPQPAVPDHDEGVGARVFWLLMGAQLPAIGWFMLMHVPQHPRQTLPVLGLQILLWVICWIPVYVLEHGN